MLDVEKITMNEIFQYGNLESHKLNLNNIIKNGLVKGHDFALIRDDNKIVSIIEYSFDDDNMAEIICLHELSYTHYFDLKEYHIKVADFLKCERKSTMTYH